MLGVVLTASAARGEVDVRKAIADSRIKGGLCVLVGGSDAKLTGEIAAGGPFLVHWLCEDARTVRAAREGLTKQRLYGQVSAECWVGQALPYADNLVSLLVVFDASRTTATERLRVLRPGGEMLVKVGKTWRRSVKPRPAGMDEWTHWRHAPDRNAVSTDALVDVPRRVQWLFTGSAIGERAHVISAKGRNFAQDRGWLIARDAFNGLPLWKVKLLRGTDFAWEYRVKVAALALAGGERVYCITADGKFKALDAGTGKAVKVYDNAGAPYVALLVADGKSALGTLVLAGANSIRALDAETGKLLWRHKAANPHNVIASTYGVYAIEGNDRRGATAGGISGRDLATGKLLWQKNYDWARRTELGAFGYDRIVYELRSPHNWREYYAARPGQRDTDRRFEMVVISAKTGLEVGRVARMGSSARHGEFRRAFWYRRQLLTEATSRQGLSIALFDLDNFTTPAEVFRANYTGDRGFGHCYPPVLTDRFYLNGQLNFTDLETRKQVSNQITRGSCNTSRSGYMPANGMIYTFPKHCHCFPMLEGNVALAPAYGQPPAESCELVKGPAWPANPTDTDTRGDWPAFRHDEHRSGGTPLGVPAKPQVLWTTAIPGPDYTSAPASEWTTSPYTAGHISPPVIAAGGLYVAQGDAHRLVALDAATGAVKWRFIANGRIDGPPTIHRGLCLFGSRSGWVYCLRAVDGAMVWKLRVAPYERRISTYGQLESPWPVHGSVLVAEGLAYVAAGIHPNADGGIRVVCFRPETGRIVWKNRFDDLGFDSPWPEPYDPRTKRPESNPWRTIRPMGYRYHDLPVRDGDAVAVSRCLFDLKTGKRDLRKTSGFYHAKSSGVYMPRTAWRYGSVREWAPPAVFLGRSVFTSVPSMSKLFRVDFKSPKAFDTDWVRVSPADEKARIGHSTIRLFRMGPAWSVQSADNRLHMNRAMLVAGERLFTATRSGTIVVHSTKDGTKLAELKVGRVAYDGLAAAGGRLYVSTEDGRVICLAPATKRTPTYKGMAND